MSRLRRLQCESLPPISRWRGPETKEVSQQVEVDATPLSPIGSVSMKTSPDVTPGGDHVARVNTEQVEDIDENVELFATIGTRVKPRTWVKKYESQACDRDKFKLKAIVLHDGSEEVHMTQPDRFAAEDSGSKCLSLMELI